VNGVDDFAACRHHLLDAVPGLEFQVLHEREQQRIRHRHRQQVLLDGNGNTGALERDLFRDQGDRRRIRRVLDEVHIRESELVRKRLRNLAFGCQIQTDQDCAQALTRALVLSQRRLQIRLGDQPGLHQAFTDFLSHPCCPFSS
jgi:hypothetical protein